MVEKLISYIGIFTLSNKDLFYIYSFFFLPTIYFIQTTVLVDLRVMLLYSLLGFTGYIFFVFYMFRIEDYFKKMNDFYLFFIKYFIKFENLLKIIIFLNIFTRRLHFLVRDLFLFCFFFLIKIIIFIY